MRRKMKRSIEAAIVLSIVASTSPGRAQEAGSASDRYKRGW
jgi:hypothetical protein